MMCENKDQNGQILASEAEIQRISVGALEQMQRGDFGQARDSLTQVIEIMSSEHPDLPEVYYERGTMHIGVRDFQSAISDFQRAERIYRERGNLEDADYMAEQIELNRREFL